MTKNRFFFSFFVIWLNATWINKQNIHTLNTNFILYSSEQCFHQVSSPYSTIYLQGAVVINATVLSCMHSNFFYKWPWTYLGKCLLVTARVLQPGPCWNTIPSNIATLGAKGKASSQPSDIFVFHREATKSETSSTGLLEDTWQHCVHSWRYLCKAGFLVLSWVVLNVLWATCLWISCSLLT